MIYYIRLLSSDYTFTKLQITMDNVYLIFTIPQLSRLYPLLFAYHIIIICIIIDAAKVKIFGKSCH